MMRTLRIPAALMALTLVGLLSKASADEVALFLEPDASSTVYFKETSQALRRMDPQPYPADASPPTGWMTVPYQGSYVGYVPSPQVRKDLTVPPGTAVYVRPDPNSQVIQTVKASSDVQVIEVRDNWVTVYYQGKSPVFFRWPEPPAGPVGPAMVTATSAPVPTTDPQPILLPAEPAAAPAAAREPTPVVPQGRFGEGLLVVTEAEVVEEPMPARPAPPAAATTTAPEGPRQVPPSLEAIMVPPPPPTTVFAPTPPSSREVARTWQGKLVRMSGFSRLFNPKYTYQLEDPSGRAIAFVDLDEALLFYPVENYWDRRVQVEGTAEQLLNRTPILIKARSIRMID